MKIEIHSVENGFIVYQHKTNSDCVVDKRRVFQTAQGLAEFIHEWGDGQKIDMVIQHELNQHNFKDDKSSSVIKSEPLLPPLEKGKALIITGEEGSGKTTTAIQIASTHGSYKTMSYRAFLEGKFAIGKLLHDEPDTLIIEDEFDEFSTSDSFIKHCITSDKVMCERKGMAPKNVKTPNFIICTGAKDPVIQLMRVSRRFVILSLKQV